jgi:hypothetical protein
MPKSRRVPANETVLHLSPREWNCCSNGTQSKWLVFVAVEFLLVLCLHFCRTHTNIEATVAVSFILALTVVWPYSNSTYSVGHSFTRGFVTSLALSKLVNAGRISRRFLQRNGCVFCGEYMGEVCRAYCILASCYTLLSISFKTQSLV